MWKVKKSSGLSDVIISKYPSLASLRFQIKSSPWMCSPFLPKSNMAISFFLPLQNHTFCWQMFYFSISKSPVFNLAINNNLALSISVICIRQILLYGCFDCCFLFYTLFLITCSNLFSFINSYQLFKELVQWCQRVCGCAWWMH